MIRIVWGDGSAGTAKASLDAALAAANVHQYNVRSLSSVVPADVPIDVAGTAPDLGPTGNVVDAVVAKQISPPGTRGVAGLAWARNGEGSGIFYEAEDTDVTTVRERLHTGIERGCEIRGMDAPIETKIVTADPVDDQYVTAVVLAVYGESKSLFE